MTLKLVTRSETISQETVDILRDYLVRAKRGELTAVAIVALQVDGSAVHQATTCDQAVMLIGAVARLLHRMQINSDSETC